MNNTEDSKLISEDAPFFKNWHTIYYIVIGFLVFCIAVFYLLTTYFSN